MQHDPSRRRFLTTTGGGALAVAVFGLAACSGDETATSTTAGEVGTSTTAATATTAAPVTTTGPPLDLSVDPDRSAFSWEQVSLGSVSAYILIRDGRAVVVDTGTSGSAGDIGAGLENAGLGWDVVDHVILTHHHGDHVGSLPAVLDLAPDAVAYAGEADIPSISSPRDIEAVGDGADVFGLKVIETPGHTPGHISVFDPVASILAAGDALNGADAMGGTAGGLAGANPQYTPDQIAADDSVRRLAAVAPDVVLPGHGSPVPGGAAPILEQLAISI